MPMPPSARFALTSLLCLSASSVLAHDFRHGPITIAHPFVRVDSACDGPVTKAYVMLLVNQGGQPDRLVGAQLGDGLRGRILASPRSGGGAPQPVAGLELPAGGVQQHAQWHQARGALGRFAQGRPQQGRPRAAQADHQFAAVVAGGHAGRIRQGRQPVQCRRRVVVVAGHEAPFVVAHQQARGGILPVLPHFGRQQRQDVL